MLSISRNCLAPPHFPESLHRTFIPQCIYSPHNAFTPCEIFNSVCFLSVFCMHSEYSLSSLVLCISFCHLIFIGLVLVPVSRHLFPVDSSDSVTLVKCCFESVFLLFIIYTPPPLVLSLVYSLLVIHGYLFYRIPGIDSVSMLSATSPLLSVFRTMLPLITWLMNPCLSTSLLPCPVKPGFQYIVHLGPSFTFTPNHHI